MQSSGINSRKIHQSDELNDVVELNSKHHETQHTRFSYRRRSGESALLFDSFTFVVRACFARRFGNQACQQGSAILQKTVVLFLNEKRSPSAAALQFILRFPGNFYTGGLDLPVTYWASYREKLPRSKITGVSRNTR